MNRIILVTESAELEARISAALARTSVTVSTRTLPADPAELFSAGDGALPEVLVLDARPDAAAALRLAAYVDLQSRGISVILVSDSKSGDIGLAAIRAGVRDILDALADIDEIRHVLDKAQLVARARAGTSATREPGPSGTAAPRGRVITVVSPKGGVGKTTVATNLAVGLAQAEPHSTVLVDLDVQFGDVASALNLEPDYFLPDATYGPATQDTMVLKTFLTLHETGLYVICGPDSPADADKVTGQDVSHLLQMLASEFRYVVVDTAPGLPEHTLAAMDQTSDLVLVTSMDVPGVRGMRKELDTLSNLHLLPPSRYVVLNLADPRQGLSLADVEATLGRSVDIVLPRSKAAPGSVNQGVPLLQGGGRDPMTKLLRTLVARFLPAPPAGSRVSRRKQSSHVTQVTTGPKPRRAKRGWYPGVQVGA